MCYPKENNEQVQKLKGLYIQKGVRKMLTDMNGKIVTERIRGL
jgi:hypothetical protein